MIEECRVYIYVYPTRTIEPASEAKLERGVNDGGETHHTAAGAG